MHLNSTKKLTLAAICFALGLALPFLTMQIPQIGSMLLPMHIPVLFCGLICGWRYGAIVGFALPTVRFLLFGMPPLYPTGVAMSFELATYGLLCGLLYFRLPKTVRSLYITLITAMIGGRVVWGVAEVILLGIGGHPFTWELFVSGALLTAIPGIVLQLILIPATMVALTKSGVLRDTVIAENTAG